MNTKVYYQNIRRLHIEYDEIYSSMAECNYDISGISEIRLGDQNVNFDFSWGPMPYIEQIGPIFINTVEMFC